MKSLKISVRDLVHSIPENPLYSSRPYRNIEVTHIVWHDCGITPPLSHKDLIKYCLNSNHMSKRGCPVPFYTYYIQANRTIYKIADENWRTWHVGTRKKDRSSTDWNECCLGISFEFWGGGRVSLPPYMLELGVVLTAEIINRKNIPIRNVIGHRELPGPGHVPGYPERLRTSCPGMEIDMTDVRNRLGAIGRSLSSKKINIEREDVKETFSYE